jgi:hypothetical protein
MPVLTEGKHPGEFIASEGNGDISRDLITLIAGQNLNGGAVLGLITASGKYTAVAPAAADGSQTGAALLYANTNATSADTLCVAVVRTATVNGQELDYGTLTSGQIAQANLDLKAKTIIVRAAV